MLVTQGFQANVRAAEGAGLQRVAIGRCARLPACPLEIFAVGGGEPEAAIQAVRVRGMQHPAEARSRPVFDHRPHDRLTEAGAAVIRQHVHIGQVGGRAVAERAREADHRTCPVIGTDHPPCLADLLLDVFRGAPASPVRAGGEERDRRVEVDPARVVIELVTPPGRAH